MWFISLISNGIFKLFTSNASIVLCIHYGFWHFHSINKRNRLWGGAIACFCTSHKFLFHCLFSYIFSGEKFIVPLSLTYLNVYFSPLATVMTFYLSVILKFCNSVPFILILLEDFWTSYISFTFHQIWNKFAIIFLNIFETLLL